MYVDHEQTVDIFVGINGRLGLQQASFKNCIIPVFLSYM